MVASNHTVPVHTCDEWAVILGAYVYECTNETTHYMSDQSYDHMCLILEERGTTIPGFSPHTGQWIFTLLKDENYDRIITIAYSWWLRYKELDKHDGVSAHCLIDSMHILDFNSYKTLPGDFM